ncbi:hypothetical protein V5E97_08560 [Singulisphaera sp. Ch08]|uniref:Uncharacterized protein n=1 Tax=Singulisphaera sp. Ch08 TaxID=3120278 RepID=A0AAU7CM36_9BACT
MKFSGVPLIILSFATVAANIAPSPAQGEDTDQLMRSIRTAWSNRQEKILTGHFEWSESCFYPKGSMSKSMIDIPHGTEVPKTDTSLTAICTMTFDKSRMHHSVEGSIWSSITLGHVKQKEDAVFDGISFRKWINVENAEYTTGIIPRDKYMPNVTHLKNLALTLHFRPLDSFYGFNDLDNCKVDAKRVPFRGVDCVRLRRTRELVEDIWYLDPNRNFAIIRAEQSIGIHTISFYDVEYTTINSVLVPSKWKGEALYKNGDMKFSFESNITASDVNSKIDTEKLSQAFPAGTVVFDATKPDTDNKHSYIAKQGGGKRYISHEERARQVPYRVLLANDGSSTGPKSLPSRHPFLLSLLISATVLVIMLFIKGNKRATHLPMRT